MDNLKPSNFMCQPVGSVLQKSEAETVARNIMVILKRTGNEFRPLSWEEYRKERITDGNFSDAERPYFDQAIPFCKSADTAQLLSSDWAKV